MIPEFKIKLTIVKLHELIQRKGKWAYRGNNTFLIGLTIIMRGE